MRIPFTAEQFFGMFQSYNLAIWPMHLVAYALGLAVVILALRRTGLSDRVISAVLALFWAWNGIAFHVGYHSQINPIAVLFGALFVVQVALFLFFGVVRQDLTYTPGRGLLSWAGGLLILYAMVIYSLIGVAVGHTYPAAPMFGVAPCPTVIFTFGILLWTNGRLPKGLVVIPFLWALLGWNAAQPPFNVREDFGLLVAGVLGTGLLLWYGFKQRRNTPVEPRTLGEAEVSPLKS